jgi:Niemann-Pick C1 protein
MMCGAWGAYRCSAKRWFEYMGETKDNPFVPFKINYIAYNTTDTVDQFTPVNPKTVPCSEKLDVSFVVVIVVVASI